MKLLEQLWVAITCVTNWFAWSPVESPTSQQHPLGEKQKVVTSVQHVVYHGVATVTQEPGPIFTPPTARVPPYDGYDYTCDYTAMKGYTNCSTEQDRGCWLYNHETGDRYDIYSDYETKTPVGINRYYTLLANDHVSINADGQWATFSKVFNNTFPG